MGLNAGKILTSWYFIHLTHLTHSVKGLQNKLQNKWINNISSPILTLTFNFGKLGYSSNKTQNRVKFKILYFRLNFNSILIEIRLTDNLLLTQNFWINNFSIIFTYLNFIFVMFKLTDLLIKQFLKNLCFIYWFLINGLINNRWSKYN